MFTGRKGVVEVLKPAGCHEVFVSVEARPRLVRPGDCGPLAKERGHSRVSKGFHGALR